MSTEIEEGPGYYVPDVPTTVKEQKQSRHQNGVSFKVFGMYSKW
jgi:hypothetical protein